MGKGKGNKKGGEGGGGVSALADGATGEFSQLYHELTRLRGRLMDQVSEKESILRPYKTKLASINMLKNDLADSIEKMKIEQHDLLRLIGEQTNDESKRVKLCIGMQFNQNLKAELQHLKKICQSLLRDAQKWSKNSATMASLNKDSARAVNLFLIKLPRYLTIIEPAANGITKFLDHTTVPLLEAFSQDMEQPLSDSFGRPELIGWRRQYDIMMHACVEVEEAFRAFCEANHELRATSETFLLLKDSYNDELPKASIFSGPANTFLWNTMELVNAILYTKLDVEHSLFNEIQQQGEGN